MAVDKDALAKRFTGGSQSDSAFPQHSARQRSCPCYLPIDFVLNAEDSSSFQEIRFIDLSTYRSLKSLLYQFHATDRKSEVFSAVSFGQWELDKWYFKSWRADVHDSHHQDFNLTQTPCGLRSGNRTQQFLLIHCFFATWINKRFLLS